MDGMQRHWEYWTYGTVSISDNFCIRMDNTMYNLFNDIEVIKLINIQRLCSFGHVVRIKVDIQV